MHIKSYLSQHNKDTFNLDKEIEKIDPDLWQAIIALTKSSGEKIGVKLTEQFSLTKRIRRFFIFCTMMFCINENYTIPLHLLITDTVVSQGGSAMLIKMLNQLGACTSSDTLARYIQHKSTHRNDIMLKCLNIDGFSVISVDNIDFLHSQARVSKGKNNSSWHGTSIQVVQPLPSLSHESSHISELKRVRGSPCQSPHKENRSPASKKRKPLLELKSLLTRETL